MSVGHLDQVLIVYSLMEHVTWKSPGPMCGWVGRILHANSCISVSSWSKVPLLSIWSVAVNHKGMVVVPYVKGLSEAFARILKSHGIATANRPHWTLQNFVVRPKDKVKDEAKTELIYRVPCKNCSSSYVGETGRKFSLRIKEHKKEVDSFTAGTQTQASRARESSVTHKSAIIDHAVEENHVTDWDKAKVVDREAQQQTRWLKEGIWTRKTRICMNRDAGSYQLSHTWDHVISRSRAPSSCKQSRRDQDVQRTSKRCC